jgi:hypothetical protein
LAQSLDGKRGEEASGYTFIAPIQRFRVGNPDFLGGFGWGDVCLWLGHDGREEDAADSGVPPVSDSEERGARLLLCSGPAHADAVKSGRNGLLGSDGPTVRKRRSTSARFGSGGPLGHRATGKELSSLFSFLL